MRTVCKKNISSDKSSNIYVEQMNKSTSNKIEFNNKLIGEYLKMNDMGVSSCVNHENKCSGKIINCFDMGTSSEIINKNKSIGSDVESIEKLELDNASLKYEVPSTFFPRSQIDNEPRP